MAMSYAGPLRASEVPKASPSPNLMDIKAIYTTGDTVVSTSPVLVFWWHPLTITGAGTLVGLYSNAIQYASHLKAEVDLSAIGIVTFNWLNNPLYLDQCSVHVAGGGGITLMGLVSS